MKRSVAAVIAAVCVVLLVSCSRVVELEYVSGSFYNDNTGVTYAVAPMCFEPVSIASEPFGKCPQRDIELYPIVGLDTSLWLSEKYEGIGTVYYAEGQVTLPDFEEFSADGLFICQEDIKTVGIANITEASDVDAVVEAFLNGEDASAVRSGERFKLKFTSAKYPGLYYSLEYYESDDGENYIFDRSAGIWRAVGDVLYKYLPRGSAK